MFKLLGDRAVSTYPIEHVIGTDEEVFTATQIIKVASGVATVCDATSAGSQMYIVIADAVGDGVTANIPVMRLRRTMRFSSMSTAQVASSVIGSKVTIHTTGLQPTATTSSGVFEIEYTDGAATSSYVEGHFDGSGVL